MYFVDGILVACALVASVCGLHTYDKQSIHFLTLHTYPNLY